MFQKHWAFTRIIQAMICKAKIFLLRMMDFKLSKNKIIITQRIGVDYAAEDALLPYRFFIKDNTYVSGKKN